MGVKEEIRLVIVILGAVVVVLAFGTIGLLSRMSPAIERVIDENVTSTMAVQKMLASLASRDDSTQTRKATFADALATAQGNITEHDEVELLRRVSRSSDEAFDGDPDALASTVKALVALGEVNWHSIERADEKARRLGSAGAWTAVLLGALGFLVALLAVRRFQRRVLVPLSEIHAVLTRNHTGDHHRRCNVTSAPSELRDIAQKVNQILDARTP
jgi:nitrate/nitrite-specific signal transduction histidine kinase